MPPLVRKLRYHLYAIVFVGKGALFWHELSPVQARSSDSYTGRRVVERAAPYFRFCLNWNMHLLALFLS